MASINPPWRFDPLQMIVNVSWKVGRATFVAIDGGGFNAQGDIFNNSTGASYPGGFNVYTSVDGKTWNIAARLGAVTAYPSNFALGPLTNGGFFYFATQLDSIIVYPNQDQSIAGLPAGYSGSVTYPKGTTTVLPADTAETTYSAGAAFNFYPEIEVTALNGSSNYIVSGTQQGVGITVVIGGNANDASSDLIPLYWRSTDGITWTLFTPPFNPTSGWFTFEDDVWFDDGAQRTTTGNNFDGEPTLLWFSSDYSQGRGSGPLYQSSDGCQTWQPSGYQLGHNVDSKTDDHFVGHGSAVQFYGQIGNYQSTLNACYGDVGSSPQTRMGVAVMRGTPDFIVSGLASDPISSWTPRTLPLPPAATAIAHAADAQNTVAYNNALATYATNQSVGNQVLSAISAALAVVTDPGQIATLNSMTTNQDAQLANPPPSAPAPSVPGAAAVYVAYAGGIFVVIGNTDVPATYQGEGVQKLAPTPVFWWSDDAVTWQNATSGSSKLDVSFDVATGNPLWTFFANGIVSGDVVDQIYPTEPAP